MHGGRNPPSLPCLARPNSALGERRLELIEHGLFRRADLLAADAEALQVELGGMFAAHERTGCPIHSAYWPARFRWLARTQPQQLKDVAHWVSFGDYLLQEFLGQRCMSYSVASWTGLLDWRALAWDRVWLERLALDESRL